MVESTSDVIKNILSPGTSNTKDEALYGKIESVEAPNATRKPSDKATTQLSTEGEGRRESETQSGGVLRQILNPGGNKYNDEAHSRNTTTVVQGTGDDIAVAESSSHRPSA